MDINPVSSFGFHKLSIEEQLGGGLQMQQCRLDNEGNMVYNVCSSVVEHMNIARRWMLVQVLLALTNMMM